MAKFQAWLEPQGLTLLEGWARDGLTDVQIAHNCGVSRECLRKWKLKYPDLAAALEKGREVVDFQVESALLRRALGYEYTEVIQEETDRGVKRRQCVKFEPPDVRAQIFWLKNRRPDKWQDRPREDPGEESAERGVVVLPEVEVSL